MIDKNKKRARRTVKIRGKIRRLGAYHLCINRSAQHIYAQVISPCGGKVLAQASSLDKALKDELASGSNIAAAQKVGKLIAERCLQAGIKQVAFDRSGYKYHGRVKALADAAREGGVQI